MFAITQLLILSITAAHLIDRRSRGVLSLLTPGIFREGHLAAVECMAERKMGYAVEGCLIWL